MYSSVFLFYVFCMFIHLLLLSRLPSLFFLILNYCTSHLLSSFYFFPPPPPPPPAGKQITPTCCHHQSHHQTPNQGHQTPNHQKTSPGTAGCWNWEVKFCANKGIQHKEQQQHRHKTETTFHTETTATNHFLFIKASPCWKRRSRRRKNSKSAHLLCSCQERQFCSYASNGNNKQEDIVRHNRSNEDCEQTVNRSLCQEGIP